MFKLIGKAIIYYRLFLYLPVPIYDIMARPKPASVEEYLSQFPESTQEILRKVQATIHKAAPEAEEKISYGIPSFHFRKKYLIYYAGYKNHIGLYPLLSGDEELVHELSPYKSGKASVQFTLDKPIPYALITKWVEAKLKSLSSLPKSPK